MSKVPSELQYTETHEWVRVEDDGTLTVGVTDHAQSQFGDLFVVSLPEVGLSVHASDDVCVIESSKSVTDVYSPVSGKIIEVNEDLEEAPGLINSDPYGDGWLFKMDPADPEEVSELLDADSYREYMEEDEA